MFFHRVCFCVFCLITPIQWYIICPEKPSMVWEKHQLHVFIHIFCFSCAVGHISWWHVFLCIFGDNAYPMICYLSKKPFYGTRKKILVFSVFVILQGIFLNRMMNVHLKISKIWFIQNPNLWCEKNTKCSKCHVFLPIMFTFLYFCTAADTHGHPLIPVDIHWCPWTSILMDIHQCPWTSIDTHQHPSIPTDIHQDPWTSINTH